MASWDAVVFDTEAATDFLDELSDRDADEVRDSIVDACTIAASESASADDVAVGQAAATIAAIWAGAPFSAGEVADAYPFIRELIGTTSEELTDAAATVLEAAAEEDAGDTAPDDLDVFLEALS
ncbi:DUF4259 domain-containing protein [Corynebacterium uberis]|uniref:DUF4259 domain-containing protein n=1 Tax=Corynebacterium TaxID=1716 RepID=UPI001D09F979|nr:MULTISPECIES: DUF4259 domain-containing protein [Corynebacterium]MCZ9309233.1 hypothetical protein [Corynebacterium sp. c6VSa_13]UDL72790.1 hypothetical protein LH391_06610 [Corynebacterium uberis]UDL76333.1 hypothetical protein LH393_02790 [Corynebacterium uberis]UDL78545.1 hypothetical protein LH394_02775 [Corynebacterium uberis]UDL80826.1 hypothetical protein LH392_03205 [Corynebacterium uberis]